MHLYDDKMYLFTNKAHLIDVKVDTKYLRFWLLDASQKLLQSNGVI